MSKMNKLRPIASALGVSLIAGLAASPVVHADENPFAVSEMKSGYMVAMASESDKKEKDKEGKCGEGKCGEKDKSKKDKNKKDKEGKCGEGKCGEGKCGEKDKDGKKPEGQ